MKNSEKIPPTFIGCCTLFLLAIFVFLITISNHPAPNAASVATPAIAPPASAPPVPPSVTELSDAKVYLSAMTTASNETADALDAFQSITQQYAENQQLRFDKTWRLEMVATIARVDNAATGLENLPPAPEPLKRADSLLHEAAKEMHSACLTYAKALATGKVSYLDAAIRHQKRVQDLATQAGQEVHTFGQSLKREP